MGWFKAFLIKTAADSIMIIVQEAMKNALEEVDKDKKFSSMNDVDKAVVNSGLELFQRKFGELIQKKLGA